MSRRKTEVTDLMNERDSAIWSSSRYRQAAAAVKPWNLKPSTENGASRCGAETQYCRHP
jgi:hypothetical protein